MGCKGRSFSHPAEEVAERAGKTKQMGGGEEQGQWCKIGDWKRCEAFMRDIPSDSPP